MEQLIKDLIRLIQERQTVVSILATTQALQIGLPKLSITVDPTDSTLGAAYTILSSDIKNRLTTYQGWLDNQIKSTAQQIANL